MQQSSANPQLLRLRVSVFLAVSLDGFIARADGGIDWLMRYEDPGNEDYGFKDFFDTVDAIVMGRNTYDLALSFDTWLYGDTRMIVLTHRPVTSKHNETAYAGSLTDLVETLGREGVRRIYLDGGQTVRQGLAAGLVDDMTLTLIPTLLGQGIPLFGADVPESRWTLVGTKSYANGLVQVRYERAGLA
ncbi:MAG TPA: dihydrofolate reductase family protein [bacterium]|nr:dihydrofolate reductase family protein [bacterium]